MPPAMTGVTLRWNGPSTSSATFVITIATANVVMKVTISKSMALRRFISGCTDTSWVSAPSTNVAAKARIIAMTGFQPATTSTPQPMKLPTITIEPWDMSRIRSVP
jgi:hypothetical protein